MAAAAEAARGALNSSAWSTTTARSYRTARSCRRRYRAYEGQGAVLWGDEQQAAFDALKSALAALPARRLPDMAKPFIVSTDASTFAVGAVLQQEHDGKLHAVEYLSKKMGDAETRYPVHEQEMLAVVTALKKWRHLLAGKPFEIRTDHLALKYWQTQPHQSIRQLRWQDVLSQFQFEVKYVRGKDNAAADALSRRPDHAEEPLVAAAAVSRNTSASDRQASSRARPTTRDQQGGGGGHARAHGG